MDPELKSASTIQSMFSRIAGGYDRANSVLSLGIHHLWKQKFCRLACEHQPKRAIDCAAGTGDIATLLKRRMGSSCEVLATDFCFEMMNVGQRTRSLDFLCADASALPFPRESCDLITIAFGIRNVENPFRATSEFFRILRPGGRLAILEFGSVELPVWRELYSIYSRFVLPQLGGMITGQKEAYHYLEQSSREFAYGEQLMADICRQDEFRPMQLLSLSGGIAWIYLLEK